MADSLKVLISEIRILWGKIGINQKIALGLLLTALVAALAFWGSWNSNDSLGLLFKDLRQKDAAEIVNVLKADGIPYRVEDNGTAVLVPDEKVPDLRLRLAGQGLPGQDEGWALFDETRLGALSGFVQQINHTRALQGELERTISRFRQIEWARVHIVEEKDSLFIDRKEAATASVLLKTRGGAQVSESQIGAIAHLIAGAVRGLTPDNVTINDYSGRQLSRPGGSDAASLASDQLEYRRQVEEHLSNRATEMLERVVGRGKAVVTVSAEIDFTSSESHKIDYKDGITKSKTETVKETTAASGAGEAGVEANLGGGEAGGSTVSSVREEKTEYMPPMPSGETKRVEPAGKIKRLAAAVFVSAGEYKASVGADGKGVRKYVPPDARQMAEYKEIVTNAIGFVAERDAITISDGEFKSTSAISGEELKVIETQNNRQFIVSLVKAGSTALGVLVFLLFARHMLKKTFSRSAAYEPVTQTRAAGMTTRAHETGSGQQPMQTAPLKEQVAFAVKEDPEKATQHLKMWMNR